MSTIDEAMRASGDATLPPWVRWVKARLAAGEEMKVKLHKPESGFGSTTTELFLIRTSNGQELEPKHFDWDEDVNNTLIDLKIRAIDLNNEGERFALGLRAALRKVERQYGDGYLNAVFLDLIDESNLAKSGEIGEVRMFVSANSPEKTSRAYSDCRDQIASEIGSRAAELREKLKYGEEELKTVMSKAIAHYLDERFSVSRRRAMGWL